MAKMGGLPMWYVDMVKTHFDSADQDNSGLIDYHEFRDALHKIFRLPLGSMVESRVLYFWNEVDTDGSCEVSFDEFLCFWQKYFGVDRIGAGDAKDNSWLLKEFYASVRRIGAKYLDPPAYASEEPDQDDGASNTSLHSNG